MEEPLQTLLLSPSMAAELETKDSKVVLFLMDVFDDVHGNEAVLEVRPALL